MRRTDSYIDRKYEQGTALVVTLLFLMALGVLSTALVFSVHNEMKSSTAYKYTQQAFYVSNGAVQKAVQWFANSYNPHLPASDYDATYCPVRYTGSNVMMAGQTGSSSHYPESAVTTAFTGQFNNQSLQADANNSGVYALNATLQRYIPVTFINPATFIPYPSAIERWKLESMGYWGTVARPLGTAQITATIENSGNALFDRALWGIDSVGLGGTVVIDSYDPNLGPYGGTNVGDLGAIGSNGTVSLNGNVTVNGDAAYGPSGSFSHIGGATVTGDVIHLSAPHYFPPIPAFTVGIQNVTLGGHSVQTIGPNTYGTNGKYGTISVDSHAVLTMNPGTYYIDQLTLGSQSQLIITGTTTLFVKTTLTLGGQGVANSTGDPTKLTVFFSGTNAVSMTGGTGFYGDVYAPNATVTLVGNSNFYGSFIGKVVNDNGTPDIHFDEGNLRQNLIQRPFRLITWAQNTY
ncbi:MAG TPA: pilus assembly PilX N-terminal domain-containing protein [Acidobacteriota bacterium]|nr:pilus assembly PilX N-terminal domain-containing protein [Acidobacteriota bacterium]